MSKPVRLQLSRRKGFDLQAWSREVNGLPAANVSRPSIWGNPFKVGEPSGFKFEDGGDPTPMIAALTAEKACEFYEEAMRGFISPEMHPWGHAWAARWRKRFNCHPGEQLIELCGHNLACWCAPEAACHADVLLRLTVKKFSLTKEHSR